MAAYGVITGSVAAAASAKWRQRGSSNSGEGGGINGENKYQRSMAKSGSEENGSNQRKAAAARKIKAAYQASWRNIRSESIAWRSSNRSSGSNRHIWHQ